MSALKYIPRIFEAIKGLKQERMTAQQALRALEPSVSKQELHTTLPSLKNSAPDTPLTRLQLLDEAEKNKYTLTPSRRTDEGVVMDHDFVPYKDFERFYDRKTKRFYTSEETRSAYSARGRPIQEDVFREFVPLETKEQREAFLTFINPSEDRFAEHARKAFLEDGSYAKALAKSLDDAEALHGSYPVQYFNPQTKQVHTDYSTALADANQAFNDALPADMHGTSFGENTTPGPKENYAETLTSLDQPSRSAPPYNEPHRWNAPPNTLFHTRSSTRTPRPTPTNPNPTPIHYGEEIQSEWSKKVREYDALLKQKIESIKPEDYREVARDGEILWEPVTGRGPVILRRSDSAVDDMLAYLTSGKPVDHPYTKNWEEHALRSLMAEAIDKDLPGMALATGRQNALRYGMENIPEGKGLAYFYDEKVPNILSKLGKKYDAPVSTVDIPLTDEYRVQDVIDKYGHPDQLRIEEQLFGPALTGPRGVVDDYTTRFDDFSHRLPVAAPTFTELADKRQSIRNFYEAHTETAPYLEFSPTLINAIKKGLPLSILANILPPEEQQ